MTAIKDIPYPCPQIVKSVRGTLVVFTAPEKISRDEFYAASDTIKKVFDEGSRYIVMPHGWDVVFVQTEQMQPWAFWGRE